MNESMDKVVYAHWLQGEQKPFFIGSGSVRRAQILDPRPERWRAYVGDRLCAVSVLIVERHGCEGRARYREAVLIGATNPSANYIAAVRSATDMLTGRRKGGSPCTCERPDCRMIEWKAMDRAAQEAEIRAHRTQIARNRIARGLAQVAARPASDAAAFRPATGPRPAVASGAAVAGRLSPAQRSALTKLREAEEAGHAPDLTQQQRGTAAKALMITESVPYEDALNRVRAAFTAERHPSSAPD